MKQTLIFVIFLLSSSFLKGQNYYSKIYKFSDSILANSSEYEAAQFLSYIGEYQKALECMDKHDPTTYILSGKDSIYFEKFHPVNAIEYIINKSKTEQIIIINEAHHQPRHRVFTTELLQGLYNQGYRYLGAETISIGDTTLNNRKYPMQCTGIYTEEPMYGDLIRTALKIGFFVFPYETTKFVSDSTAGKQREIEQAKNIKKILDKDPKAKILIHCGYDHIIETELPGWGKAMAGRLTEFTGINPFTINQERLTEHSSSKFDNPFFKMIDLNYSAVFIDSSGNLFNGVENFKEYDVRVYHPRTIWIEGRPDWVFENDRKPRYINDEIKTGFPCLVLAYLSNECILEKNNYKQLVPFDIIELKNGNDKKALALKNGDYDILIQDTSGHEQVIKLEEK
ncbi:MAG: hypothetical protein ACXVPU_16765 [Bacteroidia bacterium]